MYKLYNSQLDITTNFSILLQQIDPSIPKTQLNILPSIIFGLINSESVVTSDIAKSLKDSFSLVQFDSVKKRICRFFNNKRFDGYSFYDKSIKFVLSKFVMKHPDKRVHISFDHSYVQGRYACFMLTLRVGKQGIPLWFRCFNGYDSKNCHDAFDKNMIIEGINYVSDLFKDFDCNLIFLADRWFGHHSHLLKHINSLGHTYIFRAISNIRIFYQFKGENHKIWSTIGKLNKYVYHSKSYKDVELFKERLSTNVVINKSDGHKEAWILVTNGDTRRAVKDYGYRYGSIESVFKNQKSNGFYLESTLTRNLHSFINLFSVTCFALLYLTILGTYYEKNKNKVFKDTKITTTVVHKDKTRSRALSLFNTGLTLFQRAYNSLKYIRLSFSMKLYDI